MDKKVNIGPIDRIPFGQGRCFIINNEEIAVFRFRNGKIFATQNRCPHRQGPLSEGIIGDEKVICPLHNHKFDLCSGQGSEPNECLDIYSVSIINNEIYLDLTQHQSIK